MTRSAKMLALRDLIVKGNPSRQQRREIARAISFNELMIRALLDGRKSQTRRPVGRFDITSRGSGKRLKLFDPFNHEITCRLARAGGTLWVRERWAKRGDRYHYATDANLPAGLTWRPAFQMPRAASRISLDVLGVRPQRLQSISSADARAEGFTDADVRPRQWFRRLWNSIYSADGLTWEDNPWVWVIRFKPRL